MDTFLQDWGYLGVFVGISHNDYQGIQSTAFDHFGIAPHTATGSAHSVAANRISYCLNLRGPSITASPARTSTLRIRWIRSAGCACMVSGRAAEPERCPSAAGTVVWPQLSEASQSLQLLLASQDRG